VGFENEVLRLGRGLINSFDSVKHVGNEPRENDGQPETSGKIEIDRSIYIYVSQICKKPVQVSNHERRFLGPYTLRIFMSETLCMS